MFFLEGEGSNVNLIALFVMNVALLGIAAKVYMGIPNKAQRLVLLGSGIVNVTCMLLTIGFLLLPAADGAVALLPRLLTLGALVGLLGASVWGFARMRAYAKETATLYHKVRGLRQQKATRSATGQRVQRNFVPYAG